MGGHFWRGGISLLLGFVVLALVAVVAFQVGAHHAAPADGGYYGPRGYGWGGGGFFFFPFLLFPIGFFLFFGLMRALFWGPRHWGGGYGPGPGGSFRQQRMDYLQEWHRRAHEEAEHPSSAGPSSGDAGGTGTAAPCACAQRG